VYELLSDDVAVARRNPLVSAKFADAAWMSFTRYAQRQDALRTSVVLAVAAPDMRSPLVHGAETVPLIPASSVHQGIDDLYFKVCCITACVCERVVFIEDVCGHRTLLAAAVGSRT
jgi:hypothetical protein